MNTPEKDERLQHELRLAHLEIKALREQLARAAAPGAAGAAHEHDAPKGGRANGANSPKRPVLYVEDSEPNFRLIESILIDRPETDLLWAETGERGFEIATTRKPELILLDLDLPDMHGSELLERLQAQPATADTPVIIISADATPSQIERMLAAGARNYLTKPFEIRRFLFMFDEVFAGA